MISHLFDWKKSGGGVRAYPSWRIDAVGVPENCLDGRGLECEIDGSRTLRDLFGVCHNSCWT